MQYEVVCGYIYLEYPVHILNTQEETKYSIAPEEQW